MNTLVTGANGFVGQALCKKMVLNGWHVRGTVRSVEKSANLPAEIEVVQIKSIGANTDWSDALAGVDTVVHLAARVHMIREVASEPLKEFCITNTEGTARLVDMAVKAGVRRILYLSTIKVNGERTIDYPFIETNVPKPEDPYAISKWEAEQVLQRVSNKTALKVVIIRSPLVYGHDVKANFLRLLGWIDRGVPFPFVKINNKRSFIYLGNLVDGIIRCIEHPDAANQTFLVSDGQDVSTSDLIRMIAEAMGKKARLFPFPVPLLKMIGKITGKSDEVERLVNSLQIDSTKIRNVLNWQPPFTLEKGIYETVKWYIKK